MRFEETVLLLSHHVLMATIALCSLGMVATFGIVVLTLIRHKDPRQ